MPKRKKDQSRKRAIKEATRNVGRIEVGSTTLSDLAVPAEEHKNNGQLWHLAKARADLVGGTDKEWRERFRRHSGTEAACPDGHPEISMALFGMGREALDECYVCPACFGTPVVNKEVVSSLRTVSASPGMVSADHGLPIRVTRQWLLENSDSGEFGTVPIPSGQQDGLFTHATYMVEHTKDCDLDGECECEEDESGMWELFEYSG